MPTFEIYTVGGAYYLYAEFNFLAAFTGSADFKLFLSIASLPGGIGLLLRMIWGGGQRATANSIGWKRSATCGPRARSTRSAYPCATTSRERALPLRGLGWLRPNR